MDRALGGVGRGGRIWGPVGHCRAYEYSDSGYRGFGEASWFWEWNRISHYNGRAESGTGGFACPGRHGGRNG